MNELVPSPATLKWAVFGFRDAADAPQLVECLASVGVDSAVWFDDNDTEDVNGAVASKDVTAVLFQDMTALYEVAIDRRLDIDGLMTHGVKAFVAEPGGSGVRAVGLGPDESIVIAYRASCRMGARRERRQVMAAVILSLLFVTAVAGWLMGSMLTVF